MLLFAIIGCMEYGLIDKGYDENLAGDYETPSEPKTFGDEFSEEETVIDEEEVEEPVIEEEVIEEEIVEDPYVVANIDGSAEFLYASDFGWTSISEAHGWYDDFILLPTVEVEETRFVCGLNGDNVIECECVGNGNCSAFDGKTAGFIDASVSYKQVSNGRKLLCGLGFDGTVDCWDGLNREFPMEGEYDMISANNHEVCGIRSSDKSVACFDDDPQLGYWMNYESTRVFDTIKGQGIFCGSGADFIECWENDVQKVLIEGITGLVQFDNNDEVMCYEDANGIQCVQIRHTFSDCLTEGIPTGTGELKVFQRSELSVALVNENTETVWGDIVCE